MACLEIKIKDQIYKITNDSQSDTVTSADWELIYNFLTKGELPDGYYVIGDNEAAHRDKLFEHLLNELSEGKTNTELYEGSLTKNISQTEFINKLVGNKDLNECLDGDITYDTNQVQKNVLWVPTWGNTNNWYGFTSERALLLTGDATYAYDKKVQTLYKAYLDLKNGSKRVKDVINTMYSIFNDNPSEDDKISELLHKATIIWAHPAIGKTKFFNDGSTEVIDFDSVYKPRINKELGLSEGEEGHEARQNWRKEHKQEYKQKIFSLFEEAKRDAIRQGKKLLVSDMQLLRERESDLDIIVNMSEELFAQRSEQRGEPYDDYKKMWKADIDEAMSNVNDKSKIVETDKYFSEIYSGVFYEKLTWLANNKTPEIVTALFTPSSAKYQKEEKALHKILQNDIDKVTGYYIYSDKKPRYVIKHRGNENNIVVLDLENNSTKSDVNINSVKAVYKPFSLRYKNSEYQLIGKTWYKINRGAYIKVDPNLSETLYAQWFGLDINDFETIDFYSKAEKSGQTDRYGQAPIFANSKIGDQTLVDILPEGSKITTSFGTYVKIDGKFIQGEFTLDKRARINNVQIPWNNQELRNKLLTLKAIEDPTPSLNDGDLRIVLQDVFGFKDFDNIFINSNQNELVKVKLFVTDDEQVVPRLQISTKSKFKVTKDNYLQLKLGVAYFKYLQDENIPKSELVANANKFWEILKDVVINKEDLDLDDDVKEEIATITKGLFDDDNEMHLIEAVDLNKQLLFQNLGKTDEEVDAFMEELMSRGLMIVSCEL